MKFSLLASLSASLVAGAIYLAPVAFAQNSPGMPGGVLQDQFRINEHPQMPFAASAPSDKYQRGTSAMRRRADNGDPNGCNLKCPKDGTN
ncbi:hypothetical protein [Caballeronia concitans]|jgi:hypothetical protein|uniref:Lipoprotein n=1 Tax=Caballeronia concitans TaxID=1777133 RepID=A0A658QZB4_9BURK|nr:hypothetical protein [Caballeronia concitans]KIG10553.1 hypothetical protein BurMR1_2761 [Burkholderia sp. MR1]SAL34380.1 hypothetical protein AWB72_03266 [Caballeronia concitans]